ncbi:MULTISPECIES: stage II sporulation protein R [Pelosinus]|uniref:Stage II sporulation protein R n=1 Tax=Pelosinus fermentans B4 TaxID=1149862 RepID=I8RF78_9FIRM|nr:MULTISPECIES: stage II sporulation protein R [Pelosinus]EIW18138.1 stage II sporulation protein R [Pelosinus fermentans B4]EIW24175.1 stage II sporulation protein R [Pelosinus fermentans A11]OAM94130.1 stage II sporulation protein R [Pelosinus fermentans DSM 17108]SDR00793.1 stage II sporulation protein R [Pelosinus fermentans]
MKYNTVWGRGLLIVLFIVAGWGFLLYYGQDNLPVSLGKENLIRLHVLANSDSASDQQLKLKVRDAVIAYLAPHLETVIDKEMARQVVLEHQGELTAVAEKVVAMNGSHESVAIELGMFDFPIKSYGNLVLPAGKYEAVRVLIGKAQGKNWWCVLFPPLCFIDITNATALPPKEVISGTEQKDEKVEFRWKLAELWKEGLK